MIYGVCSDQWLFVDTNDYMYMVAMDIRHRLARSRSKGNSTVRKTTPLRLYLVPVGEGGKNVSLNAYLLFWWDAISPIWEYESKKDRVVTTRYIQLQPESWGTTNDHLYTSKVGVSFSGEQLRTAEHIFDHTISLVDVCQFEAIP